MPAGTVADEGIADPGGFNFYLVAHEGIKGTSIPTHYTVLHSPYASGLRCDRGFAPPPKLTVKR